MTAEAEKPRRGAAQGICPPHAELGHRRGYSGEWRPPRVVPKSAEEYVGVLARVEDGEQRSMLMRALGERALAFYAQLRPEHFQRAARELHRAALGQGPHGRPVWPRTRSVALNSIMRCVNDAATLMPELARARQTDLLQHLEALLLAFFQELDADKFAELAAKLAAELGEPNAKAGERFQQSITALRMVMGMLRTIVRLQSYAAPEQAAARPSGLTDEEIEREVRLINAEIVQEEHGHAEQDPPSGAFHAAVQHAPGPQAGPAALPAPGGGARVRRRRRGPREEAALTAPVNPEGAGP